LGAASSRFVQSAEIAIFDNPAAVNFIILEGLTDSAKTLMVLGKGETRGFRDFTGFYSIPNFGGTINFTLVGTCSGGGILQGFVNVAFFS